ncbi:MFS transporter [Candidatus Bathyarchaeota archaeon]|nr:MFS transporter [Candidatus Bathyarchaeota archaeon]
MKDHNKPATSSRRNIFALGFVSFFTDLSSEMVLSLLPTFILSLPGSSIALLGLIEGVAEALSYGMRAISGVFSDKLKKRKTIVLIGYGLSNIIKPFFSVTNSAYQALTIRIFDRVGKGIRTSPRDALICESVSEENRGAAFGLHRSLDQAGAIIGPLFASVALLFFGFTVREIFWLSIIPGVAALIILIFFVKELRSKTEDKFEFLKGIKTILQGNFLKLLIIISVFSLGAFNFSFILLYGTETGISSDFIPLLFALVNISHVAIAIPAGLISDRIGREKMLLMGYFVFLIVTLIFAFGSNSYFVTLFVAVFFGLYEGIVNTVSRAMIPKYVKSSLVGTAYGLYYLVVGFSFLFANILVGLLWNNFGSNISGLYSLVLTSISLVGFIIFIKLKT